MVFANDLGSLCGPSPYPRHTLRTISSQTGSHGLKLQTPEVGSRVRALEHLHGSATLGGRRTEGIIFGANVQREVATLKGAAFEDPQLQNLMKHVERSSVQNSGQMVPAAE